MFGVRGICPLCAVQAMMPYLAVCGDAPGPQFVLQHVQPLSCSLPTSWRRQIIVTAGISGNSSSHSFLIGVAIVAVSNGVPNHLHFSPVEALTSVSSKLS